MVACLWPHQLQLGLRSPGPKSVQNQNQNSSAKPILMFHVALTLPMLEKKALLMFHVARSIHFSYHINTLLMFHVALTPSMLEKRHQMMKARPCCFKRQGSSENPQKLQSHDENFGRKTTFPSKSSLESVSPQILFHCGHACTIQGCLHLNAPACVLPIKIA